MFVKETPVKELKGFQAFLFLFAEILFRLHFLKRVPFSRTYGQDLDIEFY